MLVLLVDNRKKVLLRLMGPIGSIPFFTESCKNFKIKTNESNSSPSYPDSIGGDK